MKTVESKYIIFDLDNCLSDDGWRIPYIDWAYEDPTARYHRYHLLAAWDEVGNGQLFESSPHHVVVFTARPQAYVAITNEWLRRSGIEPVAVYMRPPGDHTHSATLKRRFLYRFFELFQCGPEQVECAYDDRPDVVKMFKAEGVNAHLTKLHTVCAYTNPNK